ncbi:hypothetical protein PVAP13_5NG087362 [Panicum virgatum]|uniref:DUF1618 domain-containing protein n=1 Tax=Panicum virgatum TaxID=38727 RepID=A0A8T0RPW8_PANVG|nr:hypothetical protein PVAP13_5NG087362 [Panicum virgatum]
MSSDVAESSRAGEEAAEREVSEQQRPWVVLSTIPVVVGAGDERIHPDTDLLLDLHDPPRPSYLLVPKRIAAGTSWPPRPLPNIAATDCSARLLFNASQDEGTCDLDYFLCDAHTRTAARLPAVPADLGVQLHPRRRSVGLIPNPHRLGHYMVAQLQPASATHYESLLYYSTATQEWGTKCLASSPHHQAWGAHGVLYHGGLLWWVDAAYGILFCDPFLKEPNLRLVPLPVGCEMKAVTSRSLLDKRRLVRPSEGELRYVEVRGLSYDPAAVDDAAQDDLAVWMWTLVDPGVPPHWRFEDKASFADIWAHDTYTAAGLTPGKVPSLAFIHPNNHGVVFFFEGASIFGLDVRARRVVACEQGCIINSSHQADLKFQYSRFVDAWELPRTLLLRGDPSSDGGSGKVPTHLLRGNKGNIVQVNGPNPFAHLLAAPSQMARQISRPANERNGLENALRKVHLKLTEEVNQQARRKLVRERDHMREMLELEPMNLDVEEKPED